MSKVKEGFSSDKALKDFGEKLWNMLPRPTITNKLEAFDSKAKKVEQFSGSKMVLIIETDNLDIPWELCVTGSDIDEPTNEHWFQRYLVSRSISDCYRFCEPETGRQRILVIYEPFDLDKIKEENENKYKEGKLTSDGFDNLKKSLDEFRSHNNKLGDLIEQINSEKNKGFQITERKFPFRYGYEELVRQTRGEKGKYDIILYIGSYFEKSESIAIENPIDGKISPFEIKFIDPSGHNRPLIFLDACKTCVEKEHIPASSDKIESLARNFFAKNSAAFVGTFMPIEGCIASTFAYHFLKSVCVGGASLADATLYARTQTHNEYADGDNISKLRRVQTCAYTLVGNCVDSLYYSFLHGKKEIKLLWSDIASPYFESFNDEIYPSGMDLAEGWCHDFARLVKEFDRLKDSKDLILLVDMPIVYAIEKITKNGSDWVIINSIFRLQPDKEDATLYYLGDIKEVNTFLLEDYKSTVSVMAQVYVMNEENGGELYRRFADNPQIMDYEEISNLIITNDKRNTVLKNLGNHAFLLSGKYQDEFENLRESSKILTDNIQDVNLYEHFKEIIRKKGYELKKGLPASVLIARREDAKKYHKLFEEILTRWYIWRERRFPEKHTRLSEKQEQIYTLDEDDKKALIDFSKLVKDGFKNAIFGEKIDIRSELRKEDFYIVEPRLGEYKKTEGHPTSPQWSAEEIQSRKTDLMTTLNIKYNEVSTKLNEMHAKRSRELKGLIKNNVKEAEEQLEGITREYKNDENYIKLEKENIFKEIREMKDEEMYKAITNKIASIKIEWSKYQ